MQKICLLFSFVLSILCIESSAQTPTPTIKEIPYAACAGCWNADSLGNHRVVVRFNGPGPVARVINPFQSIDSFNTPYPVEVIATETEIAALKTSLKWLNSTMAQEDTVIAPYIPLTVQGDTLISLLGRKVQLSKQGFPEQIETFFTPGMTDTTNVANPLLAENIHFHFVRQSDGKDFRLKSSGVRFTERSPGTLRWEAVSTCDELRMEVSASMEFDGFLAYTVKVTALKDLQLKDIVMHIPFQKEVAKYMMGLGQKGGNRPDSLYHWKWDVTHKDQDGAWIGTVNAGLLYSLRDEHYSRPLNTNFYLQKPLMSPSSWDNGGKGGIDIGIKGKSMLAHNYSGRRDMKQGDTLYYNFTLLITPFHPLNTDLYMEHFPYLNRLWFGE